MIQAVKNRRSLTPIHGVPIPDGSSPTRRNDVRREVSERIQLRRLSDSGNGDGAVLDGWALNVSRGGLRCILDRDARGGNERSAPEERVELGDEFEITVGEEGNAPLTRRGRIVWLQEEADGFIAGIEFLTPSGTHRAAPEGAAPEGEI